MKSNKPATIHEDNNEDEDSTESSIVTFATDGDENNSNEENEKSMKAEHVGLTNGNHTKKSENELPTSTQQNGTFKDKSVSKTIPQNKCTADENKQSLPWICLKPGLSTKASPYTPSSWVNVSLTLDGRDKITKVIQYVSRFLFYYTQQDKWQRLQKSLTTSRKAYRLGRSFIELFKIYNLGLGVLPNISNREEEEEEKSVSQPRPRLLRKVLSNIGFGIPSYSYNNWPRLLSSFNGSTPTSTQSTIAASNPLNWRTICAMFKLLGLTGFWFGDNVTYLIITGFLQSKHKQSWQFFAARCYFFGALVGLYANVREIVAHRLQLRESKDTFLQCGDVISWEKTQCRQFSIIVALLKSCCDVLVFSNIAGIDVHKKYCGKKMHEGFHCLCGLVSACTVLYNNFPNAENNKNNVVVSKMKKKE